MRAAAITPATPHSVAPTRRELNSGFFDVDAMVTLSDRELSWSGSGPTPSLILPITGPGLSLPPARPLPPITPPHRPSSSTASRQRSSSSPRPRKPTKWDRASEVASMLGFAAAWVATTGAGAVVVAAFMTRGQPPAASMLAPPPSTTLASAVAQCPKSWEPPLVAVNDLPVAMDDAHSVTPPAGVWRTRPLAAAAPVAVPAPAPVVVTHHAAPRPVVAAALAQKADSTPAPVLRPARAKTVPAAAPSGPPHSLEDWIRRAVATDSKH